MLCQSETATVAARDPSALRTAQKRHEPSAIDKQNDLLAPRQPLFNRQFQRFRKDRKVTSLSLPPSWGKARMGGGLRLAITPTLTLPHQGGGNRRGPSIYQRDRGKLAHLDPRRQFDKRVSPLFGIPIRFQTGCGAAQDQSSA